MDLRFTRQMPATLVAGALSGAATEVAIVAGQLRLLTVFAGVWVVAAGWLGRRAAAPRAAALASACFLVAMVCAFYLTVIVMEGEVRTVLWLFWIVVALTGGPLLGLAGHLAGGKGTWAGLAAAGLAGLLVAEGVRLGIGFWGHHRWLYAAFDLVAAVVVLRWPEGRSRRIAAAALLPALLAGAIVFTAIPLLVYGAWPGRFWH